MIYCYLPVIVHMHLLIIVGKIIKILVSEVLFLSLSMRFKICLKYICFWYRHQKLVIWLCVTTHGVILLSFIFNFSLVCAAVNDDYIRKIRT